MKIVNRREFLKLPVGTAYAKGQKWYFEALCFKGQTVGEDDWAEYDFVGIDSDGLEDATLKMESMLNDGSSYPMQDDYYRDACFDDEQIFMIFERDDLEIIKKKIEEAIQVQDQ